MSKTKSDQIMALYDGVRTTKQIAEIVGCRPEYVRVVARQRKGSGSSEIDLRYRASPLWRACWQRSNVRRNKGSVAAANKAKYVVVRRTADDAAASKAAKAVYDAARLMGRSVKEAKAAASAVRQRVLRQTCDMEAANRAYREAYRKAALMEAAE